MVGGRRVERCRERREVSHWGGLVTHTNMEEDTRQLRQLI